jgi:hypothetical protein
MMAKSTKETMQNKIINLLGLALAGLCLAGCAATPTLTRLDGVAPGDAIVVAKFHVLYNGQEANKDCSILLDAPKIIGTPKYAFALDENGYVFTKMAARKHQIDFIITAWKQHHFKEGELTCEVNGGAINYLGDIKIDWKGVGNGTAVLAGGGFIGALATQGRIVVTVDSNVTAAQEAFRQKFPTDRTLTPSLLVVNPGQSQNQ